MLQVIFHDSRARVGPIRWCVIWSLDRVHLVFFGPRSDLTVTVRAHPSLSRLSIVRLVLYLIIAISPPGVPDTVHCTFCLQYLGITPRSADVTNQGASEVEITVIGGRYCTIDSYFQKDLVRLASTVMLPTLPLSSRSVYFAL